MEITQIQGALESAAARWEDPDRPGTMRAQSKAALAQANMAELVALGRLFHAVINCRECPDEETAHRLDDDMDVLAPVDDEISALIVARRPATAADYVMKAGYLLERARTGSMSQDVMDAALAALIAETAVLSDTGLPASASREDER
nr:hypothetical protein [uncultured Roseococcus sp.]